MKQLPRKSASGQAATRGASPAIRWLFRLVALVAIPLVLLAVTEAGLRLGGFGFDPGLFRKIKIGGEEYFVNNETFGLRFFPPQLARSLGPIRMPVKKPEGSYRIFILGESAAMGDPEPSYGAGRYLEALLSARYPKTHFEIVNLGITAINSHVILPIARECARHEGDLWIIYMGNNEMVGPFGAATVFGAKAPPLPLIGLNLAIQKTRLGQLLEKWGRKLKGENAKMTSWGGMEMFVGNQLQPGDPRKEIVYQNFERNLNDIIRAGLGSGAKVLLNTVAVNLKDCAPFASLGNSNLPSADRARFGQLFADGVQAGNRNEFAGAAQQFESAAKLDGKDAALQFRWGECLLALTNIAAAREHLQLACDDDALPFRADGRINSLIAAAGRQAPSANLVLFDAAGALASNAAAALCGDETFYEHVHFNFDGSYRLACAWAGQVAAMLPADVARSVAGSDWASQETCERRLGLSEWNRALVTQEMIARLQQPPLSGQLNNEQRLKKLEASLNEQHSRMNAAAALRAKADFELFSKIEPDDYSLRENFALFLQSTGDLPGAIVECREVRDLIPQDSVTRFELGRMLELNGEGAEAESSFRLAVEQRPTLTEGWVELGKVQGSQEKFKEALASFAMAKGQRPQDPQPYLLSGKALAKMNRHMEAMEQYRAAINLSPAGWEAHYELGGELDSANQLDAARSEFGEAARLNPGNARIHFNHGVLLAKLNRIADARLEFEEALRLEPNYAKARDYLSQIRVLKRPSP